LHRETVVIRIVRLLVIIKKKLENINDFDVNTSLKSLPGTLRVRKRERQEISSNLFREHFHDVIVRSGPL